MASSAGAFGRLGVTSSGGAATASSYRAPGHSAFGLSVRGMARRQHPARTMAPDRQSIVIPKDVDVMQSLTRQLSATEADRSSPAPQSAPGVGPAMKQPGFVRGVADRAAALSSPLADDQYHPSQGWRPRPSHLSKEQLWETIRAEAAADAAVEPALASFLFSTILSHSSLEKTFSFLLSNKLANSTVLGSVQLMGLLQSVYASDPDLIDAAVADMLAVKDRDPACEKYTQCLLYFKGFQAIQCHRVAHWLWTQDRQMLALAIQSRISEVFHVDIHPGAQIGRGILLDHATGVVIGETAVLGDNVSMLHHVSLGGSGTGRGVRHPTIGHGVLLGAGVSVIGPIVVGAGSKVGAGSVVVSDLPAHSVAVGVPAKVIKRDLIGEPVKDMDQCLDYLPDYVI